MITSFTGVYRYLSNPYPVNITYEGLDYPSVEHAYQAAKFLDDDIRQGFSQLRSWATAKRFAHMFEHAGLLRPDWQTVSLPTMRELVTLKFKQAPYGTWLVGTGTQTLLEGNTWHDNFFGMCVCGACMNEPKVWHNWLGTILMDTRAALATT